MLYILFNWILTTTMFFSRSYGNFSNNIGIHSLHSLL
jgi:hypothetical protein